MLSTSSLKKQIPSSIPRSFGVRFNKATRSHLTARILVVLSVARDMI
jgi:hypothetical protein